MLSSVRKIFGLTCRGICGTLLLKELPALMGSTRASEKVAEGQGRQSGLLKIWAKPATEAHRRHRSEEPCQLEPKWLRKFLLVLNS
jgi:hypothetical protein